MFTVLDQLIVAAFAAFGIHWLPRHADRGEVRRTLLDAGDELRSRLLDRRVIRRVRARERRRGEPVRWASSPNCV